MFEDEKRIYDPGRGHDQSFLWFAFIIFIIFAIFIFAFLRGNRREDGGLTEALAVPLAMKAANGGDDYKMWDHARDDLIQLGDIKKEIVVTAMTQTNQADNRFHEIMRQQCQDTASIKAEMNNKFFELAKEQWMIENKRLSEALLLKEIKEPKAMYAMSSPYPIYTPPVCGTGYGAPAYA